MIERTNNGHPRPRVLLVDDHEISRMSTVAALRETAVAVKEARTFAEAKELALRWLPTVICTDLDLDGVCGLDLVRVLRSEWPPGHRRPAVIVISGHVDESAARKMASLDVHCALVKPLDAAELLHVLAALTGTVSDPVTTAPRQLLPELLEQELEQRLPKLDQLLDAYDLHAAAGLLHQLVAASAICGNRRLERNLRELYEACRTRAGPEILAGAYFRTLQAVEARRHEMEPTSPP